jgi:hypothetical protein
VSELEFALYHPGLFQFHLHLPLQAKGFGAGGISKIFAITCV